MAVEVEGDVGRSEFEYLRSIANFKISVEDKSIPIFKRCYCVGEVVILFAFDVCNWITVFYEFEVCFATMCRSFIVIAARYRSIVDYKS